MKIHVYCRSFAPAIGGMERLLETLAREFARAGHDVHVVTETPGEADLPFPVYRAPGFRRYVELARASDVILSAPLSLRRLPAQIVSGKPIVVAHPIAFGGAGLQRLSAHAKGLIAHLVTNIVPSGFLGQGLPRPIVIANPYDTGLFHWPEAGAQREGIVFAGRLIRMKGAHLLVEAFARIAHARPGLVLTIVGNGPEEGNLRELAASLGIGAAVRFTGPLRGEALASEFRRHAIMVVPTEGVEAFGIIALEGLASGCRMIVARSGGLPEAVGPYALLFERGDVAGLAACLEQALAEREPPTREAVEHYLEDFAPERIAARYLEVLEGRLC
ncbi:glycosyltransferase family 4 protein [Altererythrobacter fulvus]|uniref:glycosyltransferase family 4 protein n=1 Tax=Caenibius fulvus TaxID=2126012 RepID=UPI003018BAFF